MAAKAVAIGQWAPGEMFQNETHWSKPKQPALAPACYADVKWRCSPGIRLAVTGKVSNENAQAPAFGRSAPNRANEFGANAPL